MSASETQAPAAAEREDAPRVVAAHVGKMFRIYRRPGDRLKDWLTPASRRYHTEFWAVRDVTFTLDPGEALGVIGPNGGGKTTLLKMIAGVTRQTRGELTTRGRSAALLELGAGFHHEFTGRQNIALNARLLGLTEGEIAERMDDIIAFAELEHFIDQPVRTYSWGMYVRLGFSVASFVDPDVLIIDEALAVGDLYFQRKSLDRIEYFRRIGKTIVFVSHEMRLVRRFCDTALWLNEGQVAEIGPTPDVVKAYEMHMKSREVHLLGATSASDEAPAATPQELERRRRMRVLGQTWGSGEVIITKVELVGQSGEAKWLFDLGERVTLRLHYYAFQRVENPQFGVNIHRIDGTYIYGGNNFCIHPHTFEPIEGPGVVELKFHRLMLHKGRYFLSVGVFLEPDDPFWSYPADFHHQTYEFRVWSQMAQHGVVPLEGQWRAPEGETDPAASGVPRRIDVTTSEGARYLREGWRPVEGGVAFTEASADFLLCVPADARAVKATLRVPHEDAAEHPVTVRLSADTGAVLGEHRCESREERAAVFDVPADLRGRLTVFRLDVDRPWGAGEDARGVGVKAIWAE